MKRRKKLWIAYAALAVVAALCAFALLYRPVPYEFLEGAAFHAKQSRFRTYTSASGATLVVLAYIVDQDVRDVTAVAQKELTPAQGWNWEPSNSYQEKHCQNSAKETWLVLYDALALSPDLTGKTLVKIERPATLTDRFLVWLHNR